MKTIADVANWINEEAERGKHEIGRFQQLRKALKGMTRVGSHNIFSANSTLKRDDYTFHVGGQQEFQFNIFEGDVDGQKFFRFALATDLRRNKFVHDPLSALQPQIERYNRFIRSVPGFLSDLKMWANDGDPGPVGEIPNNWVQEERFICIGDYYQKPIARLTDKEWERVIKTFDRLLPVYAAATREENQDWEWKAARICWNRHFWQKPSGPHGKSQSKGEDGPHEAKHGYGNEEWLFDPEKTINGYQYGFLEPLRKNPLAHAGHTYNIRLYTYDSIGKQKYWVGEIKNADVLHNSHYQWVLDQYRESRWLAEMEAQIDEAGGNAITFKEFVNQENILNIRFKWEDATIYEEPVPVDKNEPTIGKATRYNFMAVQEGSKPIAPLSNKPEKESHEGGILIFNPGSPSHQSDTSKPRSYTQRATRIEARKIHQQIQTGLYDRLVKVYGEDNVAYEQKTGSNTSVDLAVRHGENFTFFEIKTYSDVKYNIREALGQILEYAYWPEMTSIKELIIVSHMEANQLARSYISYLREQFNLPVYYQCFDTETGLLGEKV